MGNGETLLAHDAAFQFRNTSESNDMLTSDSGSDSIIATTSNGEPIAIEPLPAGSDHDNQQIIAEPIPTTDSGDSGSSNSTLDDETAAAAVAAQSA